MVRALAADRCISVGQFLLIRRLTHFNHIYRRSVVRAIFVTLWFAALISAIVLHRSGVRFQSNVALLGLGIALGSAAGNLSDIIRYRGVRDFIDLHWWPVFNLADVGIIAGLIVAFWPAS